MDSPYKNLKLFALASLWAFGLGLLALAFVKGPRNGLANPSAFLFAGSCFILSATVWMYWDHKRRRLTPDEEMEHLLLNVAKRYRQTRSLDAIVEEYRMRGATDDTLSFVRAAPRMLKTRADAKVQLGLQLLGVGIILLPVMYWTSRLLGGSHYEVSATAIGGGLGFILTGLWQQRAFPKNLRQ